MFRDKKILVTGSQGMIGKELTELLLHRGAKVYEGDIKDGNDLTNYDTCLKLCDGMDIVFHLAGIKGNPRRTNEKPVDFMVPMLQFDTNMIKAAQEMGIKKFFYTSSIAV